MAQKIKYEPHPVSPERKAELRAAGYKIVDARFDPKPSLRKAERAGLTAEAIDGMSKDAVRKLLDAREIEYDGRASLDDLRDLAKARVLG